MLTRSRSRGSETAIMEIEQTAAPWGVKLRYLYGYNYPPLNTITTSDNGNSGSYVEASSTNETTKLNLLEDITEKEILARIQRRYENWDLLRKRTTRDETNTMLHLQGLKINKVVCLALGSFHSWGRANGAFPGAQLGARSINQFVALQKVMKMLGKNPVASQN